MSTNQHLKDAVTRHGVLLNRYSEARAAAAKDLMIKLKGNLILKIHEMSIDGDFVNGGEIQYSKLSAFSERIFDALDKILFGTFENYKKRELVELLKFARSEGVFNANLLTTASTIAFSEPTDSQITLSVMSKQINSGAIKGLSIPELLDEFSKRKTKQVLRVVSDGILEGKTTPQIAKALGELFTFRINNQAMVLARTLTNAASSNVMESTLIENSELLDGYEFVATLDSRTTLICASKDGKKFNIGAGPKPPLHHQCRSRIVPVVKPEYNLGSSVTGGRSSVGSSGPKQVGGETTYGSWLKRQSHDFQDIALGPERAELFRGGKIKIENFVDPTGRTYTLDELQSIYPSAF